jgi:hypothetical protein
MMERHHPSATAESAVLVERICGSARSENRAAAAQLVAIGELFVYRLSRCSETEDWNLKCYCRLHEPLKTVALPATIALLIA